MQQSLLVGVREDYNPADSDTLNDRQFALVLGLFSAHGMVITAVSSDMLRIGIPETGTSAISAWSLGSLLLLAAIAFAQRCLGVRSGFRLSAMLMLMLLTAMAVLTGSQQGMGLRYYNSQLGSMMAPKVSVNLAYICALAVIVICFVCFMNVLWTGFSGSTIGALLLTEAFVATNMYLMRWLELDGSWLDIMLGLVLVVWFDVTLYCMYNPAKTATQMTGHTALTIASQPFVWPLAIVWVLMYRAIRSLLPRKGSEPRTS